MFSFSLPEIYSKGTRQSGQRCILERLFSIFHFSMRPRISIRGLVRPSVGWSVGPLVRNAFMKIDEK